MPRRPSPGPDASNTGVLRQIYGIGPAIKDSGVAAATVAPGSGLSEILRIFSSQGLVITITY